MSSDFRKPNSGSKKEDKITSSTSFISNGSNSDSSVSLTEEQKRKLVDTIKERVNEGIEKSKLDLENEDIRPSLSEQGTSGDMGKNALLTSALIQKAMEKVEATQKPYDYSSNPHINVNAQRQEKINQYRQEARKKAEKEVERTTAHMQNAKARIALKIAGKHLDDIAFSIAEKMAAQANRGGLRAVMPIMITYFLALLKDSGDLILTLLNLTGIGAIVGTVLASLIGLGIALLIIIFWSLTAGDWKGGYLKKKALKKILLRYGLRYSIAIGLDAVPFINIVPVFIIFNIWSHYDFIKEVKKSKKEHAEMTYDWNHGRKISMKNLEANGPNSI